MATATKAPSDELAKLQRKRDAAHVRVRDIRAEFNAWCDELPTLRAQLDVLAPDSAEATKLQSEVAARVEATWHGAGAPSPYRDDYAAAQSEFTELDAELQAFRREHCRELIAQRTEEAQAAIERMREGWALVAAGAAEFSAIATTVQTIASVTPGLERDPHVTGNDPRPAEWARQAAEILDGEIVPPGLTPKGEWRLTR